ncbi:hypothetical protein FQR65_LT01911 [Abscondita terminalis]|nr:hypothetical protein FQR65_LT01911 [Abscondita terminalis]
MMSKIVFFALSLLCAIVLSESLKCHKCDGSVGSDCAKGISSTTIETCSPDVKNCESVDITGAWTGRSVSRGCQIGPLCENLKHAMDIGVNKCVECSTDACNSAPL